MQMEFNPNQANNRKRLYFREILIQVYIHLFINATVKLTHGKNHLAIQLDNKMSFNEHTYNEISKAKKVQGFFLITDTNYLTTKDLIDHFKFFMWHNLTVK